MTVYVDDMHAVAMGRFRGMRMSHMLADTEAELHAMAARIGIERRWFQHNHYDVPWEKRQLAVALGAVEVTMRQLASMAARQRETGQPGPLAEAEAWARAHLRARMAAARLMPGTEGVKRRRA